MGSFATGFLGTIGQTLHEKNLLDYQYTHQGHAEMAHALFTLADTARDPEFANQLRTAALKYMSLAPGKKPGKDLDLHNITMRQVQNTHQNALQQQAQQAQPQANLDRLTPPPSSEATGPQQGFQQGTPEYEAAHKAFPNATNPTVTSGPASNPGPALSQLPPQWSGPVPGGDQNLPTPPQFAGKPNMPGGGMAASGTPNVVAGGAAPSGGFGVGLPSPPGGLKPGEFVASDGNTYLSANFLPDEQMQRTLALDRGKQRNMREEMLKGQEALSKFNREQDLQTLNDLNGSGAGNYKMGLGPSGLSVQQDAGKPIPGIRIDPNTGQAVRTIKYANGKSEQYPVQNFASLQKLINPATGQVQLAAVDRQGQLIDWVNAGVPLLPSSMYPTQTTSSHGVVHDVVDPVTGDIKTGVVNVGSSSTHQKVIPGITPGTTPPFLGGGGGLPSALPAPPSRGKSKSAASVKSASVSGPAPTSATTPTFKRGGSIPGVKVIGESPTQRKMELQNPLNPTAQTAMEESMPVLNQVDRAMAMLDKIKDDNTPYTDALKRLGYAVGSANDVTPLINNLELGKVIGAARLLKGSSRSLQALNIAMTHLPDPKKDSPKLMYEKLQNIKQNLQDIQNSAQQFGRKYPGLKQPPAIATPPSGGNTVLMRAPNGQTQPVPVDQVEHYKSRGAVVVTQ